MIKKKETSLYESFYKKNCFSVDAYTFSTIKNTIIKHMKDDKCPDEIKILYSEWLFKKIYMYYKPSDSVKKDLIVPIQNSIQNSENTVTKSIYLRYHDLEAMSMVALYFYKNRFSDREKFFILQMLNDVQLIKNYLSDGNISPEDLKDHFVSWIKSTDIFEQQSNLLDVLLKNFPNDKDVKDVYERMRWKGKKSGMLYDDEQNVHDEDIQKSVTVVADEFMEWYQNTVSSDKEELKKDPTKLRYLLSSSEGGADWIKDYILSENKNAKKNLKILDAIIERIKIDNTIFGDKYTYTIFDILVAVVHYVHYSPSKKEMLEILLEEMVAMVELCSSGYVARLLNVLQGFSEKFQITISNEKHLYAVLSFALSKELEKADEEVILGSCEEEYKEIYLEFIIEFINDKLPELMRDYGENEVKLNIETVVEKLCGQRLKYDGKVMKRE